MSYVCMTSIAYPPLKSSQRGPMRSQHSRSYAAGLRIIDRLLIIAGCMVCRVAAEADQGQSNFVIFTRGNEQISVATDNDLAQAQESFKGKINEMKGRWNQATNDVFGLVDDMTSQQMSALGVAAKEILVNRARQLSILEKASQRLQVATRHGVFGKCCCSQDASGECGWRDVGAAAGTEMLMCPNNEVDYYEHRGGLLVNTLASRELQGQQAADAQTFDMLLDACVSSREWQRHHAANSGTDGALPAEASEEAALAVLTEFQNSLKAYCVDEQVCCTVGNAKLDYRSPASLCGNCWCKAQAST